MNANNYQTVTEDSRCEAEFGIRSAKAKQASRGKHLLYNIKINIELELRKNTQCVHMSITLYGSEIWTLDNKINSRC